MSFALIIEDELLIAFSVEDALYDLGYEACEIAASVELAVEAAKRRCPDLIITDHRIVGGTGTDAVLEICSDKEIPVVFVTASGPEILERLPNAHIVEKPFSLRQLQSAISSAIARPFRHRPDPYGPQFHVEQE